MPSSIQHPASAIRLDSHQHFWSYDAQQYPWIPQGSALQRDWLPNDLAPLLARAGLDGCVAVQARQTVEESRWLLTLADHAPIVKGVVGWVDLRSDKVEEQLAELSKHPKFVGVRHVVQDEPEVNFMLGPEFLRGVGKLKQFKLCYEILIYPKQLPAAIELVKRLPDQPFVLDHIAKPFIKDGTISPWREQIRQLAKAKNVFCKVSGMVTEASHTNWKPADLRRYLDVIFEAFGEDRLMFGSENRAALPPKNFTRQLTRDARAKFFGGNAARFYGVSKERPGAEDPRPKPE